MLSGAIETPAMAFRVSTMQCDHSASSRSRTEESLGRDKHKIEIFYGCVPFDGFFQHSDARARELHCHRQPNIAQANNSYVHYLISLSEAAAFCTGGASEG